MERNTQLTSIRRRDGHKYKKYLKLAGVVHTLTRVSLLKQTDTLSGFHRTLLDEFFLITIRKNVYLSLAQLQDDLDRFMVEYKTHQGIKLGGVAPIKKFVSGMKILLMIESKN